MMTLTTSILCGDQTLSKEGSNVLIIMKLNWDVSPGPRTIKILESIKMIVVIPNKNMDPGEWDKGPLELQGKARREPLSVHAGEQSVGNGKERARTEVS
jgi:hypothetical protein